MPKVTYVTGAGGDWAGLYINGSLVTEGHSLPPYVLFEALEVDYTEVEVNQDWLEEDGLPYNLGDIPKEKRHG